jgi:tetratricopeptide (TPR) repeat protein
LETVNPTELRFQADALSLLGNITYLDCQSDIAEKYYRLAAELRDQLGDQPEVGRLFGAVGRIHIQQGNYVRALEDLQLALTRLPSDLALQTDFATALWLADQSQAAAAVFGAVLFVEPDSADALAGRGQIRAERGNAAAALDDLQTLQRIRPRVSQKPEVRSAYALALALAGRSETAMAEANAALASTHDSAVILLRAARVALVAGAVDRARELLRMAEGATRPALSSHQRAQMRRKLAEASGSEPATKP